MRRNILKRYGRVWIFWGSTYTDDGSLPPHISRASLVTILPPYWRGPGIALRLRRKSLRLGVCRMYGTYVEGEPPTDEELAEELALAGARSSDADPKEITTWDDGRTEAPPLAQSLPPT